MHSYLFQKKQREHSAASGHNTISNLVFSQALQPLGTLQEIIRLHPISEVAQWVAAADEDASFYDILPPDLHSFVVPLIDIVANTQYLKQTSLLFEQKLPFFVRLFGQTRSFDTLTKIRLLRLTNAHLRATRLEGPQEGVREVSVSFFLISPLFHPSPSVRARLRRPPCCGSSAFLRRREERTVLPGSHLL